MPSQSLSLPSQTSGEGEQPQRRSEEHVHPDTQSLALWHDVWHLP